MELVLQQSLVENAFITVQKYDWNKIGTLYLDIYQSILDKKAHLFYVKDSLLYVPATPLGSHGTGSQGHSLWSAKNPSYGATFSLYIKDVGESLKAKRQKKEKDLEKNGEDVFYPSFEEIRA